MQFRRMSSTNRMRFAVASFEPMTVIISVVQTTGLLLSMGEEYMQRQRGNGRPQIQSQASPQTAIWHSRQRR